MPTLTDDQRTLVFHRPIAEPPHHYRVRISHRSSPDEDFGEPVLPGSVLPGPEINQGASINPHLSPDSLMLLFGAHPGPLGRRDLFISRRDSVDSPFQAPVHLGRQVNSPGHGSHGWLSPAGSSVYFESDRGWPGKYDIYRAWCAPSDPQCTPPACERNRMIARWQRALRRCPET